MNYPQHIIENISDQFITGIVALIIPITFWVILVVSMTYAVISMSTSVIKLVEMYRHKQVQDSEPMVWGAGVSANSRHLEVQNTPEKSETADDKAPEKSKPNKGFLEAIIILVLALLLLINLIFVAYKSVISFGNNYKEEYPVRKATFTVSDTKQTSDGLGTTSYTYTVKPNKYGVKTVKTDTDVSFKGQICVVTYRQGANFLTGQTADFYDVTVPTSQSN